MHHFSNSEIAEILELTAQLMELHNENPFKIRALNSAAFKIYKTEIPLINLSLQELETIDGIGKGIAQKIVELHHTGTTNELEELKKKTPPGLLELFKIKGLGPKKIAQLWHELGIESLGELMYACSENRLIELKGFGIKTQESIIKNIQFILKNKNHFLFADAENSANQLIEELKQKYNSINIKVAGQLATKQEIVNTIILIIQTDKDIVIPKHYNGLQVDAVMCKNAIDFEYQYFINSSTNAHIDQLKQINENVVNTPDTDRNIYKKLNLQYIEPELREGLNEIELAKKHGIPNLITLKDIKGVVHCHTTYSDGQHSIQEMAVTAKEQGFEYIVISDHSISAAYAGGLTLDKIKKQHEEIDNLNKSFVNFKIVKGIESDIRINGDLDYTNDILKSFDVVIASIHQGFAMDANRATNRLIKAIENPFTNILGHLTGRLLLSRAGYPVNHKKIIDACAANNVAIELNAHPYRLDIDWRWISYCIDKNVFISINPDAHSKSGINDIKYGVNVARKGMLTAQHCLNAYKLDDFLKRIKK
jgi:DNA polymerase (family 10)